MAKPLYHTIRWLGAGGQCRETPERGDLGAHVYSDGSWQSCLALVPIARMYDHPLFEAARRSNDYRLNDLLQPSGYLVNDERSGKTIGIIARGYANLSIKNWSMGIAWPGKPEEERYRVDHELTPLVTKQWVAIHTDGALTGPAKTVRDEIYWIACAHRQPYDMGEMPSGEDAAALEGITL